MPRLLNIREIRFRVDAVIALEDRNNLELFFSSSDDSDTNDAHCSSFHKMIDYLVHTSNIRSIDCKEFKL